MNESGKYTQARREDYEEAAEACIRTDVGTATTLTVKLMLRDRGLWATQGESSRRLEAWALKTGRVWNDVRVFINGASDTFRVYRDADTPGKPPKSIHSQPPVPLASAAGDAGGRTIKVGSTTITFKNK